MIVYGGVQRLIRPIGTMKLFDFDVVFDRHGRLVREAANICDAVAPRRAHGREALDNASHAGIAGCLRDHLLRKVIE